MIRSAFTALLLAAAAPLAAQTVAITGGTVALGDGSEPIQGGTVVIRDGRIVGAGASVAVPPGAEMIDARGKWVTPGIVAGFSRIGLSEVDLSADGTTDDKAQTGPFSAAIDVAPAINPLTTTIPVNRADGVTRAIVAPNVARNIFAGQGAVIDLGADMDPITARRRFQFVELGETGAATAGGSRASAHVLFRNALREAAELQRFAVPVSSTGVSTQEEPAVRDPNESRLVGPNARRSEDVLLTRFDAAALVPVLQGRQYLLVHVERASDILQVLALKREFPAGPRSGREQMGLVFGGLVADGFLIVECQKQNLVEELGRVLLRQAHSLGVGDRVMRHSASLMEHGKRGDWTAVRRELISTQDDVEQAMTALRDQKMAHLISLGGWLRGLEIASGAVESSLGCLAAMPYVSRRR